MKITQRQARLVGEYLGMDFKVFPIKMWVKGMTVELEHGKSCRITNVTSNDLIKTGKIALAHILEYPNYYEKLEKMERRLDKQWRGKTKPKVLARGKC